jgi:phosphohistidine phosphatase
MKKVILLRHGEAEFSANSDFKRHLTLKGKNQLNNLGQSLKLRSIEIDQIYCSSSLRTVETAEIIQNYIPVKEVHYEKEMYSANLERLLIMLEKTSSWVENCLIRVCLETKKVLIF